LVSPRGVPDGSWYYVFDAIGVHAKGDPTKLRKMVPEGMEPRDDLWFYVADIVSFSPNAQELNYEAPGLLQYREASIETVVCFELELSDRTTKYLLGDISNLSRICDYGFLIVSNAENLAKRACKASIAFSILHGALPITSQPTIS